MLLWEYYRGLFYFLNKKNKYTDCEYFKNDLHAKIHVYSISRIFVLWDEPHYRNDTFQQDLVKNLRNVAIPGTCIPLSIFGHFKWTMMLFFLVLYPMVVYLGRAICKQTVFNIGHDAKKQLLNPQDWFFYWRLNCVLASLHALKSHSSDYQMEDKWTFLETGLAMHVSVSPFESEQFVIKDKNEEGGMGIFFYDNAAKGGNFIIQKKLYNSEFIQQLLPASAPLSTFRIITSSNYGLRNTNSSGTIEAISCCFRAGLENAKTDHEAIMFDVNLKSGVIGNGSTTNHWYKVGWQHVGMTPLEIGCEYTCHPDTNKKIKGTVVSDISSMVDMVEDAHLKMLKTVPLVGWDVALTTQGMFLLEVNLSCNFFRASFDEKQYFKFIDVYFKELETY